MRNSIYRSFCVLLLIFRVVTSAAQLNYDNPRELFMDAEYFLMSEEHSEALPLYQQLLLMDQENANVQYRIGQCYLNMPGQETRAIPYLEYAVQYLNDNYSEGSFRETKAPPEALFMLGQAYHINNEFNKAIHYYLNYREIIDVRRVDAIDYVNKQIECCEIAQQLMNQPASIEMTNLGERINTGSDNYKAVISGDGNTMVYMTSEAFYKSLYESRKVNGEWTAPRNITPEVGSDGQFYCTSLSHDGKELYLVLEDLFNPDIYRSVKEEGRWTRAQPLEEPVNSKYWESHAFISSDGNSLYFTSNRKGGYGQLDIYRSTRTGELQWSEPVNLGPTINTQYNEETPFLTNDEQNIYFSSQGHYCMGGYDIFYSSLNPDGEWNYPINIGYPINTTGDDLFYCPYREGNMALVSRLFTDGIGGRDIYRVEIFSEENPRKLAIEGTISLGDLKDLPENLYVYLTDPEQGDTLARIRPDREKGTYSHEVIAGNYQLSFRGSGYQTANERISIPADYTRSSITVDVELVPEAVGSGEYVLIKSILFGFDSYALDREDRIELERLAGILRDYPNLLLEIEGHTDAIGPAQYNIRLSRNRAQQVIQYLTGTGLSRERFVAKAAGESRHIAINRNADGSDNPEGRRLNRRVELRILNPEEGVQITQEINVPEHLRPEKNRRYFILVGKQSGKMSADERETLEETLDYALKEIPTTEGYYYLQGEFLSKQNAIENLNRIIDLGHREARIIDNYDRDVIERNRIMATAPEKEVFTVQVMALRNPVSLDYFEDLEDVEEHYGRDGYYRYATGEFETLENATDYAEELSKHYNNPFALSKSRYRELAADKVPEDTGPKTIRIFTIQLKAFRHPVSKGFFSGLEEISVYYGKDGLYRYTYGEYDSYKAALNDLELIRKSNYEDSFIRNLSSLINQ